MNIFQKIIISIALIFMGVRSIMFSHYTYAAYDVHVHGFFIMLMGVAMIAMGLVVLFSSKHSNHGKNAKKKDVPASFV